MRGPTGSEDSYSSVIDAMIATGQIRRTVAHLMGPAQVPQVIRLHHRALTRGRAKHRVRQQRRGTRVATRTEYGMDVCCCFGSVLCVLD